MGYSNGIGMVVFINITNKVAMFLTRKVGNESMILFRKLKRYYHNLFL